MDVLANLAENPVAPVLLVVGVFVLRLLPLVSDRVNARAVRLAKARHKQSEPQKAIVHLWGESSVQNRSELYKAALRALEMYMFVLTNYIKLDKALG